jgi:hypothetical protein
MSAVYSCSGWADFNAENTDPGAVDGKFGASVAGSTNHVFILTSNAARYANNEDVF